MKKGTYTYHKGIECLECGDQIFSEFRHDFRYCRCGACFVDGGFDYLRYGAKDMAQVKIIRKRRPRRKRDNSL